MLILCLLVFALSQDGQVLVLKNGKTLSCQSYERHADQVEIQRNGQVFTLPDTAIDWKRTEEAQQAQQPPKQAPKPTPPSDSSKKQPRPPIVLTNDNFQRSDAVAQAVTIPFTSIGNTIIVDISINGNGPYKMLLDTGASITLVHPDIASKHGQSTNSKLELTGLGGSVKTDRVLLREFAVGGAVQRDFAVASFAVDAAGQLGVIGLLGQDFLGRYLMEVDTSGKVLTLKPISAAPTSKQAVAANYNGLIQDQPRRMAQFNQSYRQMYGLLESYMKGERPQRVTSELSDIGLTLNEFRSYASRVQQSLNQVELASFSDSDRANIESYTTCYGALDGFLRESIQLTQIMRRAFSGGDSMRDQLKAQAETVREQQRRYEACLH